VLAATKKAKEWESWSETSPYKSVRPYPKYKWKLKQKQEKKCTESMVQVPSKYEILNSIPNSERKSFLIMT
jgi:hypothetical protein